MSNNLIYNNAKADLNAANWVSFDVRAMLVGPSYTPDASHAVVSQVVGELTAGSYSRKVVTGRTAIVDDAHALVQYIANNPVWIALGGGETVKYVILYKHVTTDANSELLCCLEVTPFVTNGTDQTVQFGGSTTSGTVFVLQTTADPLVGPPGPQGPPAYSTTTSSFVQPAVGATATVPIMNTAWMAVGQGVYLVGGGYYTVASILSSVSASLRNLGDSVNAAVSSTVAGNAAVVPAGLPGEPGASAGYTPIAVMIDGSQPGGDVTNLAVGPTAWAGYTLQVNDQVGLRNQSNSAHIGVATYAGSGVFTMNSTQPPNNAQLVTLQGNPALQSFVYTTGAIGPMNNVSSGTIVGANGNVIDFAPDPAGGTKGAISNPGIDQQAIPQDGAWHTMYTFDCVGRGFTSGAIDFTFRVIALDNTKPFRVTVLAVGFCSATPANPIQRTPDIDDDGSGPYVAVQVVASGSAFLFQVKNLQIGTTVKMKGIASFQAYIP